MKDMEEGFKESVKENIIFFPIRHHSPACSHHLNIIIEEFKPDSILIEGPSDCEFLMKYMVESEPPFCIYSSYVDGSENKYRSYYPFLDYSPEFVAIKKSYELKINCSFIDAPFSYLIENARESRQYIKFINDDKKFDINDYTVELTKKSGLRSFAEFWERDFEIKGILKKSEDFIKSVYALGYYMRSIEKEDEETEIREYFMASNIGDDLKKHDKVLVITGSFHVNGIIDKLKKNIERERKYIVSNSSNYLIPYSFEEADQRKGYRAGIEFPAFYSKVWNSLKKGENAYNDIVRSFIIKTASINADYHNLNLPDCINAYYMAVNLAKLRGKESPGVYELIDAAKSAFVNGEISLENTSNIELMMKLLSGISNGKVSSKSLLPPAVIDFRNLCGVYRIRIDRTGTKESILDIVKDKKHFEKSKFFHKMQFLEVGFCKLEKGPDYINKIDKNLARETWKYEYKSAVESLLIDKSVYGVTIEDICSNLIKDNLKNCSNAGEVSKLMAKANVMGLYNFLIDNYGDIEDIILRDCDFLSLCDCINNLSYIANMETLNGNIDRKELFENTDVISKIESLMKRTFYLASVNMEFLKNLDEETSLKYSNRLKSLYIFALENPFCRDIEIFNEKIDSMISNTFGSSHIYAVCLAIKYKSSRMNIKEFAFYISNFLKASDLESVAYFLNGIFLISRDILFINDTLIKEIDEAIKNIEYDKFIEILPNLRYAFTNLSPDEIYRLSFIISKIYGASLNSELSEISIKETERALKLDEIISEEMKRYGIF